MWLFGGEGYGAGNTNNGTGFLNDLWKYDPVINEWTWMKGDSVYNNPGVYGSRTISFPANKPSARGELSSWLDKNNNLWLFGGQGNLNYSYGSYGDLWKYNIALNEWTWMNGANTGGGGGVKGIQGIPSPSNFPPGTTSAMNWLDSSGNFWLLGGRYQANTTLLRYSDLWKYNVPTNEWTWIGGYGDKALTEFGIKGVPTPNAHPGARENGINWISSTGDLWMFGGEGYAVNRSYSSYWEFNDVWKYTPGLDCLPNTWVGSIDSDWDNPRNWSCSVVPDSGTNITISPSVNQPFLNHAIYIDNLNLFGTLHFNNNSVTINGVIIGNGFLSGTSASDLILTGDAGVLKFSSDGAVLHSLNINSDATAKVSGNLIIGGQ